MRGKKQVIQTALDKANISPASISYYEAHGTGTLLGDPIEIKAMSQVYQSYTDEKGYCAVGSVKSNMGHLLHAAGIAGLLKTLFCLQHQVLVPTLHCDTPHPRFGFGDNAFYPNTQTKPWVMREGVRRAAISSFGFGGTNAHLILEQAPEDYQARRTSLPVTLFNRQRFWLGETQTEPSASLSLGDYIRHYHYNEPYLKDHTVFGQQILLGVTHCSLAIEAFQKTFQNQSVKGLHKIYFCPSCSVTALTNGRSQGSHSKCQNQLTFESYYCYEGSADYQLAASGEYRQMDTPPLMVLDFESLKQQSERTLTADELYAQPRSIVHGPSLQTVRELWIGSGFTLAKLVLSSTLQEEKEVYTLHPAFLDGAILASLARNFLTTDTFIPFFI